VLVRSVGSLEIFGGDMNEIMQERLSKAIEWMGERWVLHPNRRVQKLRPNEHIELHRADVSSTFARVRKAMAKESA
jgi:hypothetical protein